MKTYRITLIYTDKGVAAKTFDGGVEADVERLRMKEEIADLIEGACEVGGETVSVVEVRDEV